MKSLKWGNAKSLSVRPVASCRYLPVQSCNLELSCKLGWLRFARHPILYQRCDLDGQSLMVRWLAKHLTDTVGHTSVQRVR